MITVQVKPSARKLVWLDWRVLEAEGDRMKGFYRIVALLCMNRHRHSRCDRQNIRSSAPFENLPSGVVNRGPQGITSGLSSILGFQRSLSPPQRWGLSVHGTMASAF